MICPRANRNRSRVDMVSEHCQMVRTVAHRYLTEARVAYTRN